MEFLKYDEDPSGPNWFSWASLCGRTHMCRSWHPKSHWNDEHGRDHFAWMWPGHFWSFLGQSKLDHRLLGLVHVQLTMDDECNHSYSGNRQWQWRKWWWQWGRSKWCRIHYAICFYCVPYADVNLTALAEKWVYMILKYLIIWSLKVGKKALILMVQNILSRLYDTLPLALVTLGLLNSLYDTPPLALVTLGLLRKAAACTVCLSILNW